MRRWIATAVFAFAAGTVSAIEPQGLVLGFSTSASTLRLDTISMAERIAPVRPHAGVQWRIVATSADERELWSRSFPEPLQFHAAGTQELAFLVAVPSVEPGTRLALRDATEIPRWTRIVDAELLALARDSDARIGQALSTAYAGTAALFHDSKQHQAREPARGQPHATDRAAAPPDARTTSFDTTAPQDLLHVAAKGSVQTYLARGAATVNNYDARVYDASTGTFVTSGRANWMNSSYGFFLPRGRYAFEIDDNHLRIGSPYFYRAPTRSAPIWVSRDTEVPVLAPNDDAGWLRLVAQLPCSLALQRPDYGDDLAHTLSVELRTAQGVHIHRSFPADGDRMVVTRPEPPAEGEYCAASYLIQVTPGTYSFEFSFPGWPAVQSNGVAIPSGGTTTIEHRFASADRQYVWRGKVLDARGEPLTHYRVTAVDGIDQAVHWGYSGYVVDGSFEIAYSPGWTIDFEPTRLSTGNVRQRFVMDGRPLPETVQLEDVADASIEDGGLLRIHGSGERGSHYNILFVAEGYTDIDEPFTDTNGNGTWDGFLWVDLNADGLFNDYFRVGGSPDFALLETADPLAGNEPFQDLNGDGILNRAERAGFESDARDFMRALLGSDFWNRNRDAFNAYLLFEPSGQAGFDVTQADGLRTLERDTQYSANLLPDRSLQVDRAKAMQLALAALPEVDMVVILVNQPVHVFARSNVTRAQRGSIVWPNAAGQRQNMDMGPSHLMAHFVAGLCDEYDEDGRQDPSGCPNASDVADPTLVPWAQWLPHDVQTPNIGIDGRVGIFENAGYLAGGVFRPSYHSTMRDLSPLFNAPSRAALERAMFGRTGDPDVLQTRPHPPAPSRIRKPHPL